MTYMLEILPSLLDGVKMTLSIFGLTIIGAIPLGMILAVGLTYQPKRWLGKLGHDLLSGYVWIFRGTPLLLQLILFSMVCPSCTLSLIGTRPHWSHSF